MQVRIRKPSEGIVQGVSLSRLQPGLTYELDSRLALYLVVIGVADPVPASAHALAVPVDSDDLDRTFQISEHRSDEALDNTVGEDGASRQKP